MFSASTRQRPFFAGLEPKATNGRVDHHEEPIATRSRDLIPADNGHAQDLEMEETRTVNYIAIKYSKFDTEEACRSLSTDRV